MKGFTLIELLAVIIILAIIALITTPIILNVVEDSRRSAAEDKSYGVVDAVRLAYQQHQMKDSPTQDNPVVVSFAEGQNRGILGVGTGSDNEVKVSISGEYPESGTVYVYQQDIDASTSSDGQDHEIGTIKVENLKFGNYICNTISAGSSKIKCERPAS